MTPALHPSGLCGRVFRQRLFVNERHMMVCWWKFIKRYLNDSRKAKHSHEDLMKARLIKKCVRVCGGGIFKNLFKLFYFCLYFKFKNIKKKY